MKRLICFIALCSALHAQVPKPASEEITVTHKVNGRALLATIETIRQKQERGWTVKSITDIGEFTIFVLSPPGPEWDEYNKSTSLAERRKKLLESQPEAKP